MYHSVTFGDKNSYDDWHLVATSRPVVVPAPVNTESIQIPGSNGVVDLTEAVSDETTYGNRQGSFTFYVLNDYKPWNEIYAEITAYLHGKKTTMFLEDEPDYYYEGRFSVNNWASNKDWSQITIDYDVGPFKKKRINVVDEWLWDSLNFDEDEIVDDTLKPFTNNLSVYIPDPTSDSQYPNLGNYIPLISIYSESELDLFYNGYHYPLANMLKQDIVGVITPNTYFTGGMLISGGSGEAHVYYQKVRL